MARKEKQTARATNLCGRTHSGCVYVTLGFSRSHVTRPTAGLCRVVGITWTACTRLCAKLLRQQHLQNKTEHSHPWERCPEVTNRSPRAACETWGKCCQKLRGKETSVSSLSSILKYISSPFTFLNFLQHLPNYSPRVHTWELQLCTLGILIQ